MSPTLHEFHAQAAPHPWILQNVTFPILLVSYPLLQFMIIFMLHPDILCSLCLFQTMHMCLFHNCIQYPRKWSLFPPPLSIRNINVSRAFSIYTVYLIESMKVLGMMPYHYIIKLSNIWFFLMFHTELLNVESFLHLKIHNCHYQMFCLLMQACTTVHQKCIRIYFIFSGMEVWARFSSLW